MMTTAARNAPMVSILDLAVPVLIYTVDEQKILAWNDSAKQIFGDRLSSGVAREKLLLPTEHAQDHRYYVLHKHGVSLYACQQRLDINYEGQLCYLEWLTDSSLTSISDFENSMAQVHVGLLRQSGDEVILNTFLQDILELPETPILSLRKFLSSYVADTDQSTILKLVAQSTNETSVEADLELVSASGNSKRFAATSLKWKGAGHVILLRDITDSVRAEEVTKQRIADSISTSRHLERLIGSISDGFFALDRRLHITFSNPVFAALAGMSIDFMQGKSLEELFPGISSSILYKRYQDAIKTGIPFTTEITNPNFPEQFFEVRVYPNLEGLFVYYRDITEEKKVRDENDRLNHSLDEFKSAITTSSIVSMADKSGIITYVNENFELISGYSRYELIGKNHNIINSGHHPKAFWSQMWKTISQGKQWRGEVKNRAKDGSYYWVDTFIMPFLDEQGHVREFLSIRNDITLRKAHAEEIIKLNRSLIDFEKAITDSSIVSRTDKNGVITYVNENFVAISGYRYDELIGQTHQVINSGYHPKSFWVAMWKTIASGKTWRAEVRNKAKDGSYYWVDTFIMPFLDKEGNVREFLSVRNDITQRKKYEQSLVQSKNQLRDTLIFGRMGSAELDLTTGMLLVSSELLLLLDEEQTDSHRIELDTFLNKYVSQRDIPIIQSRIVEGSNNLQGGTSAITVDFEMITAKGRAIHIEAKGFFNATTAFGILHDVTDRVTMEKSIHERALMFNRLLSYAPGVIYKFSVTKAGHYQFDYVSDGATTLLGISADEIMRDSSQAFGIVHREDIHRILDSIRMTYEYKTDWSEEFRIVMPDGTIRWLSGKSKLIQDQHDELCWYGFLIDVSHRIETDIKLKESHKQYATIIDNLPGYVYRISSIDDFVLNFISRQSASILGYTEDEFLTTCKYGGHVLEEDLPKLKAAMQKSLTQNLPYECKYRVLTKKNELRWVFERGMAVMDETGNLKYIEAFVRDITKSISAEEQLKLLANIANRTSNAVILTDLNSQITWVNEGFERITGYTSDEVMGKKPGSFLQGDETDKETVQYIRESIAQKKGCKVELLNYRKSGEPYWLDIEIMPIHSDEGQVVGFMAIESDITSLKNALMKAQRIEHTLQTFMDHAPLVAFVKESNGKYTFFNKAYTDFMQGKNLRAGMTDYDLFDKAFADECIARDHHILTTSEVLRFEHQVGDRTFLEYKFPLKDTDSRNFAVGGLSIDITEKLQAQQSVVENEERLRSIMDNLPDGVIYQLLADENGDIIKFPFIGGNAYSMFGLSDQEIMEDATKAFHIVHPEDISLFFQRVEKSRIELTPFDIQYRMVAHDGKVKWIHSCATPKRLDNGFTLWNGLSVNITKEKKMELALRASEAKLQSIFNSMYSGVVVVDTAGEITFANSSASEILQLEVEEIEHRYYSSQEWRQVDEKGNRFPVDQLPLALALNSRAPVANIEHGIVGADGQEKWLSVNAAPLFDLNHTMIGAVASFLDITEKRKTDQKLKDYATRLKLATETAGIGVWEWNLLSNEIVWDDVLYALTGIDTDVLITWPAVQHVLSVTEAVKLKESLEQAFSAKQTSITEIVKIQHGKTKSIRSFLVKASIEYDSTGSAIRLMGVNYDITNLENSSVQLKKMHDELNAILNASTDSTFFLDDQYRIRLFNKTADQSIQQLLRRKVKIGDSILDYSDPALIATFKKNFTRALAGEIVEVEREVSFGSHRIWSNIRYLPVRDASNNIIGVSFNATDITKRKLTEFKLLQNQQQFELAATLANMGEWEYDLQTKKIRWSDQVCTIHDVPDGFMGSLVDVLHFYPHPHDELISSALAQCIREGHTFDIELMLRTSKHRERYIRMIGVLDRTSGKATKVFGLIQDITEQKSAAQILEEKTAFLEGILESIDVGIVACNAEGRLTLFNRATEIFHGLPAKSVDVSEWSSLYDLYYGDGKTLMKPEDIPLYQALTKGQVKNAELIIKPQNGSMRQVICNGRQLTDKNGALLGAVVAMQDETELNRGRKQLQVIGDLQNRFIVKDEPSAYFDFALEQLLVMTDSEYGFIGEVLTDAAGNPYLKTMAITNISWNDETLAFYNSNKESGLEFRNLNTLFGAVMKTGELVIANHPETDSRRGGIPKGHPALNSFVGIPLFKGEALIGLLGMANRPGGYTKEVADNLEPLCETLSNIIEAFRNEKARTVAEDKLRDSEDRFRQLFELNPLPTMVYDERTLIFLDVNLAAVNHYGYSREEFLKMKVTDIRPPDEKQMFEDLVLRLKQERMENQGKNIKPFHSRSSQHFKKDGTVINVEVTSVPLYFNNIDARVVTCNDITELIQNEKRLVGTLNEKETLIKEMHHRVKNNLQLISSILYLKMNHFPQQEVRDFMTGMREKIKSISLIHERLLQSGLVNTVNSTDYLEVLIKDIKVSFSRKDVSVDIQYNIHQVDLLSDVALYCGLIVNELVTNALKYAFQDRKNGIIRISLERLEESNLLQLCISDDGIGLPENINPGGNSSFGMQLLNVFVQQLHGQLNISRISGTVFTVVFRQEQ